MSEPYGEIKLADAVALAKHFQRLHRDWKLAFERADAEADQLRAELARRDQQITAVRALADDLLLQMTANIPLGGPNVDWDPHDEFKRCAIDRQRRTKRFHSAFIEALGGAS